MHHKKMGISKEKLMRRDMDEYWDSFTLDESIFIVILIVGLFWCLKKMFDENTKDEQETK